MKQMTQVYKGSRLSPLNTIFMACDIQETPASFNYHVPGELAIEHNAMRCGQVAQILNIPVIATYMAKFGPLSSKMAAEHPKDVFIAEKISFSMLN